MNPPSVSNTFTEEVSDTAPRPSLLRWTFAWAVHAYTASGAVIGFLALHAILAGHIRSGFAWMLVAVLVDATDGTLARAVNIKHVLPHFDGAKLDDIVDYFTFVIVPLLALYYLDLLPVSGTVAFIAIPLMASAYGFCQAAAKTPDFFFTGFPSYWNIVAFYLYAAQTPPWMNGVVLCALSVMVFVPIRYIYPTRTLPFRRLTNVLGSIWVIVLLILIWQLPTPSLWLLIVSLYYPVYYTAMSMYLHFTHSASLTS